MNHLIKTLPALDISQLDSTLNSFDELAQTLDQTLVQKNTSKEQLALAHTALEGISLRMHFLKSINSTTIPERSGASEFFNEVLDHSAAFNSSENDSVLSQHLLNSGMTYRLVSSSPPLIEALLTLKEDSIEFHIPNSALNNPNQSLSELFNTSYELLAILQEFTLKPWIDTKPSKAPVLFNLVASTLEGPQTIEAFVNSVPSARAAMALSNNASSTTSHSPEALKGAVSAGPSKRSSSTHSPHGEEPGSKRATPASEHLPSKSLLRSPHKKSSGNVSFNSQANYRRTAEDPDNRFHSDPKNQLGERFQDSLVPTKTGHEPETRGYKHRD